MPDSGLALEEGVLWLFQDHQKAILILVVVADCLHFTAEVRISLQSSTVGSQEEQNVCLFMSKAKVIFIYLT